MLNCQQHKKKVNNYFFKKKKKTAAESITPRASQDEINQAKKNKQRWSRKFKNVRRITREASGAKKRPRAGRKRELPAKVSSRTPRLGTRVFRIKNPGTLYMCVVVEKKIQIQIHRTSNLPIFDSATQFREKKKQGASNQKYIYFFQYLIPCFPYTHILNH